MLPSMIPSFSQNKDNSPSQFQVVLFFFSLYLVAIGQSGHKPCTQAFGADQFDGQHPVECKAKSSFFNWWYFGLCIGLSLAFLILSYIQDNLNWGLGFGIPCIVMAAALLLFLLGTKTYRYAINTNVESPFMRIGKLFVAATRNWRIGPPLKAAEEAAGGTLPDHHGSHQFEYDHLQINVLHNLVLVLKNFDSLTSTVTFIHQHSFRSLSSLWGLTGFSARPMVPWRMERHVASVTLKKRKQFEGCSPYGLLVCCLVSCQLNYRLSLPSKESPWIDQLAWVSIFRLLHFNH